MGILALVFGRLPEGVQIGGPLVLAQQGVLQPIFIKWDAAAFGHF